MVKKDHIKDLCGSNRARKLEKCASFEFFSSQLTENKAVAGRQKNVSFAQNGFVRASMLFHNCDYSKTFVFVFQCYIISRLKWD